MFTAKVYNVMVGSLSGIMEDVTVVKEVIRKWNQENAEHFGKVFMIVERATMPEVVKNVDVVICVVGNWIENAEFVEECAKEGKQVVLLFNTYYDPENTIPCEQEEVKAFHERVQRFCNCIEFRGVAELKQCIVETFLTQTV